MQRVNLRMYPGHVPESISICAQLTVGMFSPPPPSEFFGCSFVSIVSEVYSVVNPPNVYFFDQPLFDTLPAIYNSAVKLGIYRDTFSLDSSHCSHRSAAKINGSREIDMWRHF